METVKCPLSGILLQHECTAGECAGCGWNPAVERERKRKLREYAAHGALYLWGKELDTSEEISAEKRLEELRECQWRLQRVRDSIKGGHYE